MNSAQLDIQSLDESFGETEAASAPFALKEQVAERLAAHRARRTRTAGSPVTPIAQPANPKGRAAQIAAAVAERYAQSQSYRAFLAEEAERAIRQAEAAAEAQNQLLFELDQIAAEASAPASTQALTVRLYEEVARHTTQSFATSYPARPHETFDEAEGLALDEEIAFRQSPVFDESAGPTVEIPANLIEFPRQLVAARKARPRLAEGPLREDADTTSQSAQLRIFEVESTQISSAPTVESAAPEWSSILLGAQPAPAPVVETPEAQSSYQFNPVFALQTVPQTAPLNLRLMAGIVDGCIVLASFIALAAAFAVTLGKLPGAANAQMPLQLAAIASAATLAIFALIYQL